MKLKIYTILLVLTIFILAASCSTRSSSSLPARESNSSKTEAGIIPKDPSQVVWEKVVIEAKKEGRLVLYGATGVSQARDPFIQAMREKFGISLDVTIAGGAELTTKLVNERRAGLYMADVYMGGASSMLNDLIPRNMFDPIEPYLILPEVKEPSAWFGGNLPFWEKQKVTLATVASIPPGETAINTNALRPEDFKSYKDLLNPKIKGLIAMSDPSMSGAALSWFHLAIRLMGEDYLREFVKQEPVITRDFRLLTEWLARGKYGIGMGINPGGVRAQIRDGASIYILPPFKEGVALGMAGGNVAVIDRNPHPNATRVFVNWVLSKEGQTIFSRSAGLASRRLDVNPEHLDAWRIPDPKIKYIIDNEDYTREEIEMKEVAKKIFEPVLK